MFFDFERFAEADQTNLVKGKEALGEHWIHFVDLMQIYETVYRNFHAAEWEKKNEAAISCLFNSCPVNLVNGMATNLRGHNIDSHLHIRRTVELVHSAFFIINVPEVVGLWLSEKLEHSREFKQRFRDWWEKKGKASFPTSYAYLNAVYQDTSLLGLHGNFALTANQSSFERKNGSAWYGIKFHDLSPDPKSASEQLLLGYLRHIKTHWLAVQFFLEKTLLQTKVEEKLKQYWNTRRIKFEDFLLGVGKNRGFNKD